MNLENFVATPLSVLRERYDQARFDSGYLIKASIETIEAVTEGKAALLDATNPAVMLLEMSSVQAATCVTESVGLLQRLYPALAKTESDLYHHMSDEDYLNRFAQPTEAKFTFAIQLQDILREAVLDSATGSSYLTLPRDTTIVVDGVSFMTLYPITITRFANGAIQISYEPDIASSLMRLDSTIIDYGVRKGTEQESWIFFQVRAKQLSLNTTYATLDKTYSFHKEIQLQDHYHHAEVYFRNSATSNQWARMKTTHTDQVFDIETPTAVLQVKSNSLMVSVPVIYTSNELVKGEIRIDVYSTKGIISMNLNDYRNDNFKVTLKAVDEVRDLSSATRAMSEVSYYVYSQDLVEGGQDPIDFETLRERVITNTVGSQVIPITPTQLKAEMASEGFDIVKIVDVVTNRIFLATRMLPTPTNERLVTAANIGIMTYTGSLGNLSNHYNVLDNGSRLTVRSNTVFLSDNGQLSLVDQNDLDVLRSLTQTAMVAQINNRQYVYTPFYYVLDSARKEFSLRAYALDQPEAKNLNFVRQNQTLQLFVNTAAYQLEKVNAGYVLRIQTRSGEFYRSVADSEVGVQLAFQPNGESTFVYIQGSLERKLENGERIFRFDILTNHDIDEDDQLCITNSRAPGVDSYQAWISLETTFHLLHHTSSLATGFLPDLTDQLIGKFLAPTGSVGNSHEQLTVVLGKALPNLWTRARSYKLDTVYKRHVVDVPLRYESTVYEADENGAIFDVENGEIQYRILHQKGDIVENQGEVIYKYRAGDVIYDENGQPVIEETLSLGRELDLLMVDGRYYFASDTATIQYRVEIHEVLKKWIVDEVQVFQDRLLEKTKIFFYPKTTLGLVRVNTENGGEDYIPAEQNFRVSLYVPQDVYRDPEIRASLTAATVKTLDEYVSMTAVNLNDIADRLKVVYGRSVRAFNVTGLGGDKNYQILQVASERNKLSLKKELIIQPDKTTIVQDAVNVEFLMVS